MIPRKSHDSWRSSRRDTTLSAAGASIALTTYCCGRFLHVVQTGSWPSSAASTFTISEQHLRRTAASCFLNCRSMERCTDLYQLWLRHTAPRSVKFLFTTSIGSTGYRITTCLAPSGSCSICSPFGFSFATCRGRCTSLAGSAYQHECGIRRGALAPDVEGPLSDQCRGATRTAAGFCGSPGPAGPPVGGTRTPRRIGSLAVLQPVCAETIFRVRGF